MFRYNEPFGRTKTGRYSAGSHDRTRQYQGCKNVCYRETYLNFKKMHFFLILKNENTDSYPVCTYWNLCVLWIWQNDVPGLKRWTRKSEETLGCEHQAVKQSSARSNLLSNMRWRWQLCSLCERASPDAGNSWMVSNWRRLRLRYERRPVYDGWYYCYYYYHLHHYCSRYASLR